MTDSGNTGKARKDALLVGAVLAALGAWNIYRHRAVVASILGGAAALLFVVAAFWPEGARRFHVAWMGLAGALGYVNSRVLLALIYFLVITPLGIAMRLFGKDLLGLRGRRPDTYWIRRPLTRQTREGFERGF